MMWEWNGECGEAPMHRFMYYIKRNGVGRFERAAAVKCNDIIHFGDDMASIGIPSIRTSHAYRRNTWRISHNVPRPIVFFFSTNKIYIIVESLRPMSTAFAYNLICIIPNLIINFSWSPWGRLLIRISDENRNLNIHSELSKWTYSSNAFF